MKIIEAKIEAIIAYLDSYPQGGAKFIGIKTLTSPKLLKKSRITGEPRTIKEVKRLAFRTVCIAANYENAVNRQRSKESDETPEMFHVESLWKGAGEKAGKHLVRHKKTGNLYLAYRPSQDKTTGLAKALKDAWYADGNLIDHDTILDILPAITKAKKQDVIRDVPWRTVNIENIVEIHFNDTIFKVAA